MSMLPARLFDVLCSERTCCQYRGDPRVQLQVLTHPNMSVFRKCDLDNGIPQRFWIETLPNFNRLVVLDLKFICTDEILQIIGISCPLLEELNIVSRVDICKSLFNASVLIRNVSDTGLCSIANLKHLRILAMDPPRNERANRVGRCVSQAGIIMLIGELPYLEELRIESCDIGSTLIGTVMDIGPLSLRKINCHFASAEGIKKLIKICPFLRELSITHLYEHNKDEILEQLASSDLRLNRLDLSFFSYSDSMPQLLAVKGCYLTHFSLWEIDQSLTFDAILSLGKCCPNLTSLCFMTQSHCLVIPRYFKRPQKVFSELTCLTIGNENFSLENMLAFFLDCTQNLQKLVLKYQTKINVDGMLLRLLQRGSLRNLNNLWLDCTLEISKDVVKQLIQLCEKLQMFTLDFTEDMSDVHKYISDNNLDLKLGSY
uniref:F-box domain-containing protein n=2 Tax=Pectinophora gossypiella TaxID=13191 RepID=A0A1E1WG35_PECGO